MLESRTRLGTPAVLSGLLYAVMHQSRNISFSLISAKRRPRPDVAAGCSQTEEKGSKHDSPTYFPDLLDPPFSLLLSFLLQWLVLLLFSALTTQQTMRSITNAATYQDHRLRRPNPETMLGLRRGSRGVDRTCRRYRLP